MATQKAPRASGGQRMPVRTADIPLDEIGYSGFTVTARTNFPLSEFDVVAATKTITDYAPVLARVVVSWNLVDDDGQPLPVTEEGARQLPNDLPEPLWGLIATASQEARLGKRGAANS